MTLYLNGRVPKPPLVTYLTGRDSNGPWEFQSTPATWARWQYAKAYAERKFGRTLHIRTGWNVYRPLDIQREARDRACAAGNCAGAAFPGSSSHGGNWRDRDCLAIDVDPNGLTWAQVWEACRAAGFECGLITAAMSGIPGGEPWHIIDFNAFAGMPAFEDVKPLPIPEPEQKDVIMRTLFITDMKNPSDAVRERRQRVLVGELTYQPMTADAAKVEYLLWGKPENVTHAQALGIQARVIARRADAGLAPE